MNFKTCLEEMKKIQIKLHDYLEDQEENTNLKDIFTDNRFHEDKYELTSLLHFLSEISNNHHRYDNFYSKIEEILLFFKEDIKSKIQNSALFNIFKRNKKLLLFLHEEGILIFDDQIIKKIIYYNNYFEYFSPEIRPFIDKKWFPNSFKKFDCFTKELPENFYENRKKGENDSYICEIIRKDSIDDFIIYVSQNNCSLDSIIDESIYETNSFLIENNKSIQINSLIEYAAFFGSIQIFNYLKLNNVELTKSLWLYAIHGKNAEIIHSLEENGIKLNDELCKMLLKESIKCHHNDIANYILNQYLTDENDISNDIMINCIEYYNLDFEKYDLINEKSFCFLCKYDYYNLVNFILKEKNIDINTKTIYSII